MSRSSIEWLARPNTLPESWNFLTGCNKVDRGCKNCYAEIMHRRLQYMYPQKYDHDFLTGAHVHEELISLPFTWKKPRTVFVNSMSDLFHPNVTHTQIDKAFAVMALTPQHTYIIATKRPERALKYFDGHNYEERVDKAAELMVYESPHLFYVTEYLRAKETKHITNKLMPHLVDAGWYSGTSYNEWGKEPEFIYEGKWPLPNVWILASVHDQLSADLRIPDLLQIPAAVRGISAEPLLGHVNLRLDDTWIESFDQKVTTKGKFIHWIITGGESGTKAAPMHPEWARSLRYQAFESKVPFFFKQWGRFAPRRFAVDDYNPKRTYWVSPEGKGKKFLEAFSEADHLTHYELMEAVGKKAAGRMLDGNLYHAFPFGEELTDDLPF